jgi:4-hydroxy-3-methylbut-2-enyl diphosphate reductase
VETVEDAARLPFPPEARLMILTQTTLSLDETRDIVAAIRSRFRNARTPPKDDICYATQNRQDAVKELIGRGIEFLLVVGSRNSSNSQRLVEVARQAGCPGHLVDRASEIRPEWLAGVQIAGVTAGASAPEHLVEGVLSVLREKHGARVEEVVVRREDVHFSLPRELADHAPAGAP